jgi:18S rRNA (guanine1575-N7)-methyltransferase
MYQVNLPLGAKFRSESALFRWHFLPKKMNSSFKKKKKKKKKEKGKRKKEKPVVKPTVQGRITKEGLRNNMSRPEHIAPPDIFYNEEEAKKYAVNSRMMNIQTKMTERAIELLCLEPGKTAHLLDIGCGSGLSGEVLSEMGHSWVGIDISPSMLGVAVSREVEGDLVCADMGQGLFFRPGSFDGCISISALQWLCNADATNHVPHKRLKVFFQSLYNCLVSGARAVFQFYPETAHQVTMITTAAMRCGFSGGLVVDYPNSTKAKKYFLCLFAGESSNAYKPVAKTGAEEVGNHAC